uniref:Type I site-specific deoxyribonuclease n=1 Tax=Caenorhabditis tropicalis TaxID=1561998 RepID=A0A1I7TJ71_9PELO
MKEIEAALHLENITSNEDAEALKNPNDTKEPTEEKSILRELINLPTVNTSVLKEIYQFMFNNQIENGIETFLTKWNDVYYEAKKPFLDELVCSMYDTVVGTDDFETYCNKQKGRLLDEDNEMQLIIKNLHLEYQNSQYLNNNTLEKLISLIIANDFVPLNFYVVLNYANYRDNANMRDKILNAVYDMHLVGYDQEADNSLIQP